MESMKTKKLLFGVLVLSLLSCNFFTQMIVPPTATPLPTLTPTFTASPSPTATPTPLIPAYVPPQCDAAAPLATISPNTAVEPTPMYVNEEISTNTQLKVLDEIEEIVEDVYIYPDYNGIDWTAKVNEYREKVEAGLDTETFYAEMQTMIFELGDEHSALVSPAGVQMEEDELEGELEFVGIGVYSDVDFERGLLTVLSVFPGSPAEFAGLQPHDSILFVDGLPITENGGIRTLGPECSAVVITVQSPGEEPRDIILVRSQIEGNIPVEALLIPTSDGSRIGYISIPTFFDESIPRQVEDALEGFGELDGLILDVRLNSGGSVDIGNRVLRLFTDGKLGEFVSRTDSDELKVRAKSIHNSQTVPLAVLVGEDTVSMGEIFAGLLKDARGAKIAGQTSLGNVEVLNGYELDDGSWLWIAASTFDSAFSEDNWEQTGIVTDIEAYAPWDTFRFETDPSIAAALELLGHE
jgi:carboxyl-terminal processing protease